MLNSVLSKLFSGAGNLADDAVRSIGKTATNHLDDLLGSVARGATKAVKKAADNDLDDLLSKAGNYLSKHADDNASKLADSLTDRLGLAFSEGDVPVSKLVRLKEYQPRTTASGAGTTKSVFEKGYQEGMVDQPIVVRKVGDDFQVLGGHSRTMGLEQRAKAGLDNPESIKARIYQDITDDEAKQISRGANQGGQYESTLDMAKSIAESKRSGLEPQVKRNNIKRGTDFDDYSYAWDAIEHNPKMQAVINENMDFSPDILIATSRNARNRGMNQDKFMSVVEGLYNADKLSKKNVDNVVNLMTGKLKSLKIKDAQSTLFGDDVGRAIDAVDLLSDFENISGDIKSKMNAIKKVQGLDDMSDEVVTALSDQTAKLEDKLKNIQDEILSRYNDRVASSAKQASAPTFGSLPPQIDEEKLAEAIPVSDSQAGLFGDLEPKTASNTTSKSKPQRRARVQAESDNGTHQVPVMEINQYWDRGSVPVHNLTPEPTEIIKQIRHYLPQVRESDIQELPNHMLTRSKPQVIKPKKTEALALKTAVDNLPDVTQLKKMSNQELLDFVKNWRKSTPYNILTMGLTRTINQKQKDNN